MKAKIEDRVMFCMYSSLPEPPTLNAILVIQLKFKKVLLFRNNLFFPQENYPSLPDLIEVGSPCSVYEARIRGGFWKLQRFVRYVWTLRRELRERRPKLVIIHDYLALLAFNWAKTFIGFRGILWFNSYDVIEPSEVFGKFSLMRLVKSCINALFKDLDYFSLPAKERLEYYPIHRVKRETFVIPNYPCLNFYKGFRRSSNLGTEKVLRLIYQGALGRGHGFENIISVLNTPVSGRRLDFTLKGWIDPVYRTELEDLAIQIGVRDQISFVGFGPYPEVPQLASRKDIGLAIFTGQDVMNSTLGTASNKIYEYAALGLPVILFDTPHFRYHLGKMKWAFFTDLTSESLIRTMGEIVEQYQAASESAINDFYNNFNFERLFLPALTRVVEALPE